MDTHAGGDKAGGAFAPSSGNAFRAPNAGAKPGEFAKPAPVVPGAGAAVAHAGKENATASRGATAAASTSGDAQQEEKRWNVRNPTMRRPRDAFEPPPTRIPRVTGVAPHLESLANGYPRRARANSSRTSTLRGYVQEFTPTPHTSSLPTRR